MEKNDFSFDENASFSFYGIKGIKDYQSFFRFDDFERFFQNF